MNAILKGLPIILAVILILIAVYILLNGTGLGLTENVVGALTGSLIGAAGIFLGSSLDKLSTSWDKRRDSSDRSQKICELVAAELANVAYGLIHTHRCLAAFKEAGGSEPVEKLRALQPRALPFTDALGVEVLALTEKQIAVLSTLLGKLALSRRKFNDPVEGEQTFSPEDARKLKSLTASDMQMLAEAFEQFAPARTLKLHGQAPELAVTLLRKEAAR